MNKAQILTLPVEWKAVSDGDDAGSLEGYIASFGTIDLGNDVVMPGALRKTFDSWTRAKSKMPLCVDHDHTWSGVVGVVTHMAEDSYGAKIRARFSTDGKAQAVRQKMIDLGGSGMSLTYIPVRYSEGVQDGRPVRYLHEVKAIEATITWVPMNAMASASAKDLGGHGVALPDVPAEYAVDDDTDLAALEDQLAAQIRALDDRQSLDVLAGMSAADHLHIGAVMQAAELDRQQVDLEAWGYSLPPRDPDQDARDHAQEQWQKANAFSNAARRARAHAERYGCGNCFGCRTGGRCQLVRAR